MLVMQPYKPHIEHYNPSISLDDPDAEIQPTNTTANRSRDSSNNTLAHDDDLNQTHKVIKISKPTIMADKTGGEQGVLGTIIQKTKTNATVYWSKLTTQLPKQPRTKALLLSAITSAKNLAQQAHKAYCIKLTKITNSKPVI